MFVAAAAGAKVAKHGGRSVSSSSGAADVMEQMGANLNLNPEQVAQSIQQTSIGFMFAPNHHSAMRYVAPVRRSLGFRSIFNILGPLTNPAGAANQLLGVFHIDLCGILSRVLQQLGSKHVLVVCGEGGLDEITLTGKTRVAELKDGKITEYDISPADFGMEVRRNLDEIKVENAQESLQKMNECWTAKPVPHAISSSLMPPPRSMQEMWSLRWQMASKPLKKPSTPAKPKLKKTNLSNLANNLPNL